jgi:hypothetical protein
VNLGAKGGVDITDIHLNIIATSGIGEAQLARFQVCGPAGLTAGARQAIPVLRHAPAVDAVHHRVQRGCAAAACERVTPARAALPSSWRPGFAR